MIDHGLANSAMRYAPHSFHIDPKARQPEREKIAADIRAFQARGGRIQTIPTVYRPRATTTTSE